MASKAPESGEPEKAAEPIVEPAPEAPAAEAEPEPEPDEPEAIDWGAEILALEPPEGGACDLYPLNKAGHSLVPASEAAELIIAHGFRVASAKKA